jgi:hypothetical protein
VERDVSSRKLNCDRSVAEGGQESCFRLCAKANFEAKGFQLGRDAALADVVGVSTNRRNVSDSFELAMDTGAS